MRVSPALLAAPAASVPWLALAALASAGCAGSKSLGAAAADSGAGDTGGGASAFAPSVTVVNTVACAEYQSAGEAWDLAITVDDPQGPDTVDDGTVGVLGEDGGELASYALACDPNGQCSGTFRAAYDGIGCDLQGSVTLEFIVVDLDGNSSAPFEYPT